MLHQLAAVVLMTAIVGATTAVYTNHTYNQTFIIGGQLVTERVTTYPCPPSTTVFHYLLRYSEHPLGFIPQEAQPVSQRFYSPCYFAEDQGKIIYDFYGNPTGETCPGMIDTSEATRREFDNQLFRRIHEEVKPMQFQHAFPGLAFVDEHSWREGREWHWKALMVSSYNLPIHRIESVESVTDPRIAFTADSLDYLIPQELDAFILTPETEWAVWYTLSPRALPLTPLAQARVHTYTYLMQPFDRLFDPDWWRRYHEAELDHESVRTGRIPSAAFRDRCMEGVCEPGSHLNTYGEHDQWCGILANYQVRVNRSSHEIRLIPIWPEKLGLICQVTETIK